MLLVLKRFVEERNGRWIDPDCSPPGSTALEFHKASAAGFLVELCPNLVDVFLHVERQFLLEERDRCWHNQWLRYKAGKRYGRYWARTSDPQLVELVLSQL